MAKIINLGKVRKQTSRQNKEQTARENRIKFGRTKAEKQAGKKSGERAKSHIDDHKLDD